MRNVFKNIIALVILGIALFIFRQQILSGYFLLQDKFFPCERSISYSIGTIDPSFKVSHENFLADIKEAESAWETSINKDLFTYQSQGGEITINLIYDNRQKTTQQLKSINTTLVNDKNSYNSLKNQLDALETDYQNKKATFESQIIALRDRQGRYSGDSITLLNSMQADLNAEAEEINALVGQLNNSANTFNNQATKYNTVNDTLGNEFEEGLYVSDTSGKRIDIYQFENKDKLIRVLMHEMGHALSLDHVNNPNAIMYQTNNGASLLLTTDDINELKAHCGIK